MHIYVYIDMQMHMYIHYYSLKSGRITFISRRNSKGRLLHSAAQGSPTVDLRGRRDTSYARSRGDVARLAIASGRRGECRRAAISV